MLPQIGVFVDYKFTFFDASYFHSTKQMQQTSVSDFTSLNGGYTQVKNKKVMLSHINYLDNFWYNPPFLNGMQIDTYIVRNENYELAPLPDQTSLTEFGYLNVVLIQDQVTVTSRVRRNAVAGTFLLIGAFISMVTRVTNLVISSYQGFSVDKSLIKKLYSWKDTRKKKKKTEFSDEAEWDSLMDQNQKKVKDSIASRRIFSYFYSQAYIDWFMIKVYRFCCCFNCMCCRKTRRRSQQEKIFMQAQHNLYNEIDLLEIVKQLRISKFMSSFILTQNQRELVKFMKQYTLITRLPRPSQRAKSVADDESTTPDDTKRTPFENLLEYKPDSNNIDALLHKGILDERELLDDTFTMSITDPKNRPSMNQPDNESEDEQIEEYFDD